MTVMDFHLRSMISSLDMGICIRRSAARLLDWAGCNFSTSLLGSPRRTIFQRDNNQ